MSGSAALILAAYHPGNFKFAGSLSGFLHLSDGIWPTLVGFSMRDAGGFDATAMWGPGGGPTWQRNDPTLQAGKLAANGTRLYVYTGNGTPSDLGGGDLPATFLEGLTKDSNVAFQNAYTAARRTQRDVQLPAQRHPQLGVLGCTAGSHEVRHRADPGHVDLAPDPEPHPQRLP